VFWQVGSKLPRERLDREFAALTRRSTSDLRREKWTAAARYQRSVDVRYKGQGYELRVPYTADLLTAFHAEHQRRYGYRYEGRDLELVTLRLRAVVKSRRAELRLPNVAISGAGNAKVAVFFAGKKTPARLLNREQMAANKRYKGPAVVTEYSATTMILPGAKFWIDGAGNLLISLV
jgi:N-methylhydantoinase A